MQRCFLLSMLVLMGVRAEVLLSDQHRALMQFYDAIGCAAPKIVCPRFAPHESCSMASAPFLQCVPPGLVTHIEIVNANLSGTIPAAPLKMLTAITRLNLNMNVQLTGTMPTQIGFLIDLQYLQMWPTGLSGTLPTELGKLATVFKINLSEAKISGTIPSQLGQLSRLQHLYGFLFEHCFRFPHSFLKFQGS